MVLTRGYQLRGVTQLTTSLLTACLQLTASVSRSEDLQEIYDCALGAMCEALGVERASILLFDDDGVMRFKAWRGLSDRYRAAVEGHTPWSPSSVGALPLVVPDVTVASDLMPHLATISAENIAAMAFIPLNGVNGVIGKFMLYYAEPHELSSDDRDAAMLVAAQVAFAVERARANAAVRASERRLRFALEAANMGTWEWDFGTNTVHWSDTLQRMHGLEPGSFDGSFQSYEREIHPDDRERVFASVRRAVAEDVAHDVEYRIVGPDGTIRWVEGKGRVERGPDGTPRSMSGVCVNVTRRKLAELARVEALEQSNHASRRLAAIVESSDDAIVGKTLDGTITSWNKGAERMFGYSAAEAVGQSIRIIIPGDRQAEEDRILATVASGSPVEIETERRRKDGRLLAISLKVSPIADEDGHVVGASKIARDISARKRDEAERAELDRRLTTLVRASSTLLSSPDTESVRSVTLTVARQLLVADAYAVWVADPSLPGWRMARTDGISPTFAGRVITSHHGASAPMVPAFSEPLAVPDVEAQPLLDEQVNFYRAEGIRSMLVCPLRVTDRAATIVFYYRAPRTFSDADIQSAHALANLATAALTTADLHDQLRTERNAVELDRQRASFLADATTVLSKSLDYERTLAAVAELAVPKIADWCGVDIVAEDGQVRRLAVAHVDPDKLAYVREIQERYPPDPNAPGTVLDVIRTATPRIMETIPAKLIATAARDEEHRRLIDTLQLRSFMCVPLVTTSGLRGAISLVFAESGRHYSEADLPFAQDLAARASLAIDNAIAYRRASEANRIKDEFLATLSHELRTPLNAILGYAQMVSAGVVAGEQQSKALSVIAKNAYTLNQIVADVLDVSRIVSGKLRLEPRVIEVAEVVSNAVATVRPAVAAKHISLNVEKDPALATLYVDPERIQQVIWNLLSNAVKFTPIGGRIEVRITRTGTFAEISVTDNGQGIDPAFLPHVFDRFRQADSSFAREHGGLGLGLAIVRELVELHGGTVSARSEGRGTGASFSVRLPLTVGTGIEAALPQRSAVDFHPVRLAGLRAIAVDDQEDSLDLVRVILESAGAEVTTATSAAEVFGLLEREPFDVLIADLGMPGVDGLQLIREIRQTLPSPVNRIPAAALTAYARPDDRITALASGFQMHLSKPVNPAELVAAVAGLVNR